MKTRVIACAIIEKDGKILLGRKAPDIGPYPNTWHLIGGGIHDDESVEEAIIREVHEETGIDIEIESSVGFDEDYEPNKHGETTHYIFLTYYTHYKGGEIEANDDIVELQWFEKEKIPKREINRASIKLFRKLGWIE